jgi:filamin
MLFLPGLPEVTLTGMKADIKVQLQNLGNSVYRATYTPSVPGAYLLNVMWSDRLVNYNGTKENPNVAPFQFI